VVEDQRDFGQVLSAISIISNIIIAIASTLDATGQDSERNIQEYGQRKIGDRSNPADIRGESKNDSRTSYEKTVSIHFIAMNANAIEKSAVSKSNHPPNSVQSRTKKKRTAAFPCMYETRRKTTGKQNNPINPQAFTHSKSKKKNQPTDRIKHPPPQPDKAPPPKSPPANPQPHLPSPQARRCPSNQCP
jgi:hypothetical protein